MTSFERQWFGRGSQLGLRQSALVLKEAFWKSKFDLCEHTIENFNFTLQDPVEKTIAYKMRWSAIVRHRQSIGKLLDEPKRVFIDGFWPGFDFATSDIKGFLEWSANCNVVQSSYPQHCCYALYSVFPRRSNLEATNFLPRILYSGESISPSYEDFDISITMDKCSYSNQNIYLPLYLFSLIKFNASTTFDKWNLTTHGLFSSTQRSKRRYAAVFVGNNDHPMRQEIVNSLTHLGVPVECYGSSYRPLEDKQGLLSQYLFNICPENIWSPGYCTEKIVDALAAGAIPIYWGDLDTSVFSLKRVIRLTPHQCITQQLSAYLHGLPEHLDLTIPAFSSDPAWNLALSARCKLRSTVFRSWHE